MRQRPFRKVAFAVACALLGASPHAASSQGRLAREGALFLLVPVGAQSVARGQASVASRLGPDGVWSNPASLGWATRREVAIDHAANAFIAGDAVDLTWPAGLAGVVAGSLLYFNFGDQAATDEFGNVIGTLYSRGVVVAATYAATFGERVSAGVSYKFIEQSQSCSGACQNQTTFAASTSAIDAGIHATWGRDSALTVGLAVRNAGFGLQTIDREQSDPLPGRVHLGAEYRVDAVGRRMAGAALLASGEVVSRFGSGTPGLRLGAELGLNGRVFLRGGALKGSGDGSTASFGFGLRQGTLAIDFARTFGGTSADAGSPPTYVTLRLGFR